MAEIKDDISSIFRLVREIRIKQEMQQRQLDEIILHLKGIKEAKK
jgi:hypothetical protein